MPRSRIPPCWTGLWVLKAAKSAAKQIGVSAHTLRPERFIGLARARIGAARSMQSQAGEMWHHEHGTLNMLADRT